MSNSASSSASASGSASSAAAAAAAAAEVSAAAASERKKPDAKEEAVAKAWEGVSVVRLDSNRSYTVCGPTVRFQYDNSVYTAANRMVRPSLPLSQQSLVSSAVFGIPDFGNGVVGARGCAGRLWSPPVVTPSGLSVVVGLCPDDADAECAGVGGLSGAPGTGAAFCVGCCGGLAWWAKRYGLKWVCDHHRSSSDKEFVNDRVPRLVDPRAAAAPEWKRGRRNSKSGSDKAPAVPVQLAAAAGAAALVPSGADLPPPPASRAATADDISLLHSVLGDIRDALAGRQQVGVPAHAVTWKQQAAPLSAPAPEVAAPPVVTATVSLAGSDAKRSDGRPPGRSPSVARSGAGRHDPPDPYAYVAVDDAADDALDADHESPAPPGVFAAAAVAADRMAQKRVVEYAIVSPAQVAGPAYMSPAIPANAWHITLTGRQELARVGGAVAWVRALTEGGDVAPRDRFELEVIGIVMHFLALADAARSASERELLRAKAWAALFARAAFLQEPDSLGGAYYAHRSVPMFQKRSWLPPDVRTRSDKAIATEASAAAAADRAVGRGRERGSGRGRKRRGRGGGGGGGDDKSSAASAQSGPAPRK